MVTTMEERSCVDPFFFHLSVGRTLLRCAGIRSCTGWVALNGGSVPAWGLWHLPHVSIHVHRTLVWYTQFCVCRSFTCIGGGYQWRSWPIIASGLTAALGSLPGPHGRGGGTPTTYKLENLKNCCFFNWGEEQFVVWVRRMIIFKQEYWKTGLL